MSKTLASFVGLLALLLGATVSTQTKADSDFKVTLLGTGTPIPDPDRFGPSTLVEAGNQKLLFDAGRGSNPRAATRLPREQDRCGLSNPLSFRPHGGDP